MRIKHKQKKRICGTTKGQMRCPDNRDADKGRQGIEINIAGWRCEGTGVGGAYRVLPQERLCAGAPKDTLIKSNSGPARSPQRVML